MDVPGSCRMGIALGRSRSRFGPGPSTRRLGWCSSTGSGPPFLFFLPGLSAGLYRYDRYVRTVPGTGCCGRVTGYAVGMQKFLTGPSRIRGENRGSLPRAHNKERRDR